MADTAGRWTAHDAERDLLRRALTQARRLGHSYCGADHVLLALLAPDKDSVAASVLNELQVHPADVEGRLHDSEPSDGTITVNPALHRLRGMAAGLALSDGAHQVSDIHALLALCYGFPDDLQFHGVTGDQVTDRLTARGVPVPTVPPPLPAPAVNWGAVVYFPADEWPAVERALVTRYPPGSVQWGFNVSTWRPGECYVMADASIPLAELVLSAVGDPDRVTVVPAEEFTNRERSSHRQSDASDGE